MGSLILKRGVKPEYTPEQLEEIKRWENIKDEDIDYSDIPAPKEGEERKWYPVNPRTPEQWERYYKYCPPHIQARHKKLRELYGPII
ncbi:MAG: hypothetical protein IJG80_02610 [Selenomonadaceae bacterium]|nr:hypothetical protein [Selenomonadaceae bacterium]MBQ3726587.1 hypothetical protein [Selenomonadaceae bacterium]MBQ9496916.1 hypothetical protein [Selenomonadaceae bacterium]